MQPREKEKYENALGSIFDFIFEESKKPPSKVKPAKVTGVDGTTEIVDALSDVLTSPLLFVNDEIRNVFNDALDADILSLKVGERVGADTIKLSLSGVKDVLSDPGSWVDKQFADLDQKRKMQKAAWAGEEAKGILGALWARERGLDFDTQMAMAGAGRQGNRSTGADTEYMMSRSDDLVSKHFGGLSGNESKSDFVRKYGRGRGERMYKAFGKWKEAKEKGKEPSINTEIYYLLESEELKEKADSARQSGDKEKAEQYMRASKYTESIPYQQKVKHQIQDQKEKLKESAKYVEQLKKSSLPDKDQKIKELRTSMKDIKSNLRYMRLDQAADILGRTQGAHLSTKELFIDGNLIPNIINGKFFDENRNQIRWLQPSKMETKKFNGKEFKIHVGKGEGGPLKSTYYSSMNAVYYMSPVTWARSLTDGEIFAYAGHIRREFLKKSEFVKGLAGFDIEEFMKGLEEGDDSYLTRIAGSLTEKQLEKLQNFAKWDKTLGNLAYVFSTPTRIKKFFEDKVKAYIEEKIMKELRKKVGEVLLKVITDKVAKKLIQSWVVTGGIKVLIKGIVTSIAAAIGLAGTPIASAIIGAVTWIASDIIYRLAKPLLKFTLEMGRVLLYFFIALVIIFFSLLFFFSTMFARFTHVSPHEVVMCEAYEPLDPIDFPDIPGGGGEDIDFECGPGETVQGLFNRMASEMGLSGAQLGLIPPGHELYGDLDGGWWCWAYSMDQVYCKSDKVNNCNDTIVRLFKHELIHLRQYRNASGSYGSLFMEWGADWLSGNGGGYSFTTKDGSCVRATQVREVSLPGCSPTILDGIAYNEASYLNSQCFGSLKKYITGFCGAP
jgi:hypothetical protein